MKARYRLIIKILNIFIPDGPYGDAWRGRLMKPFLKSCGSNFKVASQAFIFNPAGLSVGDNVYIGFNTYLGQGEIHLEDEVLIGNGVSITASNHLKKNGSYRFSGFEPKMVTIKKGAWIAANSAILAGITVGTGACIGAGAVVTKDVPDDRVYVGIPARDVAHG
ncbi:acyltransferase [Luminiphilus sp.]|nr:acyltransferase [Luminiphilus sp.]